MPSSQYRNMRPCCLNELRRGLASFTLLPRAVSAVDAIDQVRYCDDEIRTDILKPHGMAMYLINDNYSAGTPGEESKVAYQELCQKPSGASISSMLSLRWRRRALPTVSHFRSPGS